MVSNRKDSCSGEWVESCGGVVCACGGEVGKGIGCGLVVSSTKVSR